MSKHQDDIIVPVESIFSSFASSPRRLALASRASVLIRRRSRSVVYLDPLKPMKYLSSEPPNSSSFNRSCSAVQPPWLKKVQHRSTRCSRSLAVRLPSIWLFSQTLRIFVLIFLAFVTNAAQVVVSGSSTRPLSVQLGRLLQLSTYVYLVIVFANHLLTSPDRP
jgi:hypothetical protein